MRTRTLEARIERAEQVAKAEHRFSAECICFPENEPYSTAYTTTGGRAKVFTHRHAPESGLKVSAHYPAQ